MEIAFRFAFNRPNHKPTKGTVWGCSEETLRVFLNSKEDIFFEFWLNMLTTYSQTHLTLKKLRVWHALYWFEIFNQSKLQSYRGKKMPHPGFLLKMELSVVSEICWNQPGCRPQGQDTSLSFSEKVCTERIEGLTDCSSASVILPSEYFYLKNFFFSFGREWVHWPRKDNSRCYSSPLRGRVRETSQPKPTFRL